MIGTPAGAVPAVASSSTGVTQDEVAPILDVAAPILQELKAIRNSSLTLNEILDRAYKARKEATNAAL